MTGSPALALLEQSASSTGVWPSWRAELARSIPGVGRAISIYTGLISQMALNRFRGITPLPPTLMMQRPDPNRALAWWLAQHVDDYLMHGNAVHYVTGRDADDRPTSAVWLPSHRVGLLENRVNPLLPPTYVFDGKQLPRQGDVVHVQRGADPMFPWRGVGVVEQHLRSLGRVYHQEMAEDGSLTSSGVPSVAVIAGNPRISDEEIDQGLEQWDHMFGGPVRKPGIFPAGTQVLPLAWSPSDAQMVEARGFSLTDVANMFNLDSYELSAPQSSHVYKSPGPMFTALMRKSLAPVMAPFESEWSYRWLPRGQELRFNRRAVEVGDFGEAMTAASTGVTTVGADGQPLMSVEEGRAMLGLAVASSLDASAASVLPTTEGDGS